MASPLPLTTFHDLWTVAGAGSPIDDEAAGNRDLTLRGSGTAPRPASHNRRRGAEFRASGFLATAPRAFATDTPGTLHTALYVSSKIQSFTLYGWVRPSRTGVTGIQLCPIGGLYSATNEGATPWVFDQPCFLFTPVTSGAGHLIVSIFGSILDTRTATQSGGSTSTTPIADNDYTFIAVRVTASTTVNDTITAVSLFTMSRSGVRRTYALGEHKAAALIAFSTNPSDTQTVTIQGRAYTFKSSLVGTPAQGTLTYGSGNAADGDTIVVGQDSTGNPITYTLRTYVGAAVAATAVIEFYPGNVSYGTSTPKTRMKIGGWEITDTWGTHNVSGSGSGSLGHGAISNFESGNVAGKIFAAWHGDYDNAIDFKIPTSPSSPFYDAGKSWANRRVFPGSSSTLFSAYSEGAARTVPLRAFDAGAGGNACEVSVLEPTAATGVFDQVCSPCRVGRNSPFIYRLMAPSTSVIAAAIAATGTGLANGIYKYTVTFVGPNGESIEHNPGSVTMSGGPKNVDLTTIPIGPSGTTARKIYRTKVNPGTTSPYFLLTTIANNTATTYTDSTADASLPATRLPTTMYMLGGLNAAGTKSVLIGATWADTQANIVKAINATGTPGTEYSADITSANPTCSAAAAGNDIQLTSKYAGSAGNGKPLSETTTVLSGVVAFAGGVDGGTADQVLIGASAQESFQNLMDAINLSGSKGIQYGDPTTLNSHVTASIDTGLLYLRSKESGTTGNGRTVASTVTAAVIRDEFNDATKTTLVGGQQAPSFVVPAGARPDQSDLRFVWGGRV